MKDDTILKVSSAILNSFITLFYLEEVKHTKVFKNSLKMNLKRTLNDLIEVEKKYYNDVEKVDDVNISDKLTANQLAFIDFLLNRYNFHDFCILQELCLAYDLDAKRLKSISDKILIDNGSKK